MREEAPQAATEGAEDSPAMEAGDRSASRQRAHVTQGGLNTGTAIREIKSIAQAHLPRSANQGNTSFCRKMLWSSTGPALAMDKLVCSILGRETKFRPESLVLSAAQPELSNKPEKQVESGYFKRKTAENRGFGPNYHRTIKKTVATTTLIQTPYFIPILRTPASISLPAFAILNRFHLKASSLMFTHEGAGTEPG